MISVCPKRSAPAIPTIPAPSSRTSASPWMSSSRPRPRISSRPPPGRPSRAAAAAAPGAPLPSRAAPPAAAAAGTSPADSARFRPLRAASGPRAFQNARGLFVFRKSLAQPVGFGIQKTAARRRLFCCFFAYALSSGVSNRSKSSRSRRSSRAPSSRRTRLAWARMALSMTLRARRPLPLSRLSMAWMTQK